ncbi:MAG: metal-dependent hydrolase, partial [Nitrososphaeria archaeon]|nr:metal-dependent hydrolase [Nitrososphaeria archaeon]
MTIKLKFYGISFFEIEANGVKIVVDPCIEGNILCPIRVEDLKQVDLILVTHGAPDHMGNAIEIQKRTGATLVSGPGVREHAIRSGVNKDDTISVLWGDFIEVKGVKIQCVECRHISFFKSGDIFISDLPLSFIIGPEEGVRIYNMGDTALFSDIRLIGELYQPNIMLVPIGGTPKLTGGWTHLAPREASLAVQWVHPEIVIPTHFDPKSNDVKDFIER